MHKKERLGGRYTETFGVITVSRTLTREIFLKFVYYPMIRDVWRNFAKLGPISLNFQTLREKVTRNAFNVTVLVTKLVFLSQFSYFLRSLSRLFAVTFALSRKNGIFSFFFLVV